jgi:hypothetical protein
LEAAEGHCVLAKWTSSLLRLWAGKLGFLFSYQFLNAAALCLICRPVNDTLQVLDVFAVHETPHRLLFPFQKQNCPVKCPVPNTAYYRRESRRKLQTARAAVQTEKDEGPAASAITEQEEGGEAAGQSLIESRRQWFTTLPNAALLPQATELVHRCGASLDHLVSADDKRVRKGETKRFC